MQLHEACNILESHGGYLEDHKTDMQSLKEAEKIFDKYQKVFGDDFSAQHDIIYVADFFESISREDLLKMHRLGFHLDRDSGSWSRFC